VSEQLQLRRGTAVQIAAFTGAQGEVVVDTTNNRAVVQDGATVGGFAAAKLSEVLTNMRRVIADAATTIAVSDRLVAYASLTAPRVVTLCAASAFPTGAALTLIDESGSCSVTNTLTLQASGSDMINGAPSAVIASAHGYIALESDGVSRWTVVFLSSISPLALRSETNPNPAASASLVIAGNVNKERVELQSNIQPQFQGYTCGTSVDAPTAVLSGAILFALAGSGYNGSARPTPFASSIIKMIATENWSVAANGSEITFGTTPNGLTTGSQSVRLVIQNTGQTAFLGAIADQSKSVQAPTSAGFSSIIGNNVTTLLLTPNGTLATGTVVLPATPIDGQIVRVISSQAINALTVSANVGQLIIGAPAAISATSPFAMIYDLASATWYRM
jgi:hypothetical protein